MGRPNQTPSSLVNNPAFQQGFKSCLKWIEDQVENKYSRLSERNEIFYIEAGEIDQILVVARARTIKWARRASNARAKNIRSLRAKRGTISPQLEGHE